MPELPNPSIGNKSSPTQTNVLTGRRGERTLRRRVKVIEEGFFACFEPFRCHKLIVYALNMLLLELLRAVIIVALYVSCSK